MHPDQQSESAAYFVILSGTYCSAEITAEFGKLPPSFLPLGQARLFVKQLALARECQAKPVLSIPADYAMSHWDREFLDRAGVRIVRTPTSLTLNEAVQFVLEVIDAQGALYILYGDTLVEGISLKALDQAAIASTPSNYTWSEAEIVSGQLAIRRRHGAMESPRRVLCGFFSFSDARALRNACVASNDFDKSVESYARSRMLSLEEIQEWHDFGHLTLIYQSRRNVLASRSFNSIHCDGHLVVKNSTNTRKLSLESNWYETIPPQIRVYVPHYIGRNLETGGYSIEYLFLPTIAELYTYGNLPSHVWQTIIQSCFEFLQDCWNIRPPKDSEAASERFAQKFFDDLFFSKTRERIESFCRARGWSPDICLTINGRAIPPLRNICEQLLSLIRPTRPDDIRVWHGDFFFGNILYDFRAARVRVIDPRGGAIDDTPSIWGDRRYDLAKLAHSIMGGYDAMLAGYVDFQREGDTAYRFDRRWTATQSEIANIFSALEFEGENVFNQEVWAMTALLFLTMLPLHADDKDRQDVMLCSGLVLAQELFDAQRA